MADPTGFARMRQLTPKEAYEWMLQRKALTPTYSWQDLMHEEHAAQFTVSRLARLDLLQGVRDALVNSVDGILSRKDWMRDIEAMLTKAGWWGKVAVTDPASGEVKTTTFDPARLKLIYDTNTRQAAAAGQWQRIQHSRKAYPYLRYITKRDGRVRELHASWDNVTLPVEDSFWQTHYPPNGWRCRCRVIPVSQREYDQGETPAGASMKKDRPDVVMGEFVNQRTGEVMQVPAGIDPGFGFNPGARRQQHMADTVQAKLKAAAPDLAATALADGLEIKPRRKLPDHMASIAPWSHPGTGQVRCYLNSMPGQRTAKIWAEQTEVDTFGSDYAIRVRSESHNRGEAANLQNDAEQFLADLAGRRVNTFAEILQLLGM